MDASSKYWNEGQYRFCGTDFLLLAALAVDDCGTNGSQIKAHTAQIMAAMSAEAFIDEFAFSLALVQRYGKADDVARIGLVLQRLEDSRVQIVDKFYIASMLLPGDAYDPGSQPFQSFSKLIQLRNSLAHPKVVYKPPGWFSYFVANGLTLDQQDDAEIVPDWLRQLRTRSCASWACRASIRLILDLIGRTRELCDKHDLPGVYEGILHQWEWAKDDVRIWSGTPSDGI